MSDVATIESFYVKFKYVYPFIIIVEWCNIKSH